MIIKQGKALAVSIGLGALAKLRNLHKCDGEWKYSIGYEYEDGEGGIKKHKRQVEWKTKTCSKCKETKTERLSEGEWEFYGD